MNFDVPSKIWNSSNQFNKLFKLRFDGAEDSNIIVYNQY